MWLEGAEERPLTVASVRPHNDRLLVGFEQVGDRSHAEALRGRYLFVPGTEAPGLPEGAYWPHQLAGCEGVSERGRPIGRVREVLHTQANDLWAAEADGKEVLIPALRDVVVSVDIESRRVVVREIPGLTADE